MPTNRIKPNTTEGIGLILIAETIAGRIKNPNNKVNFDNFL
jgi:hypothetical protein